MQVLLIIIVSIAVLVLVVFTIVRNNKDRKDFERQLKNDDSAPIKHNETNIETDAETEDTK